MKKRIISTLLALNLCLSGVTALAKPADEVAAQDYKEYMSKQTLDIVQTSKHISALTEMLVKQEQVINTLKNENETLKRENAELRDRIYNLERDDDMEL